jgi:hypothetical protein
MGQPQTPQNIVTPADGGSMNVTAPAAAGRAGATLPTARMNEAPFNIAVRRISRRSGHINRWSRRSP